MKPALMKLAVTLTVSGYLTPLAAQACTLEVDGKKLEPVVLGNQHATMVSDPSGGFRVVQCGMFTGTIEGANGIDVLEPGTCRPLNTASGMTLFACKRD